MSVVRGRGQRPGGGSAARPPARGGDRSDRRDRAGKAGEATAGVKRQYMGCAGRVANGINTVHLSYVRERPGRADRRRQWIPAEHRRSGESLAWACRRIWSSAQGQLAIAVRGGVRRRPPLDSPAATRSMALHPVARVLEDNGRELRGRRLHPHLARAEADLRQAVSRCEDRRRWESAPRPGQGERWYAWAWIATASARHHLLIRRHLKTGDLAFHYCWVPEGQVLTKTRLIHAAGLRWPVEEDFAFGKDCFGLDQCQARLYTAIARHTVLVIAALAICAITAALVKDRTDTQAPPPVRPGQPPPAEPGMIPLTIPEIKRLLAALTTRPLPRWLVVHWDAWTRRHQARSRWFHKRARLARDAGPPWSASEMRARPGGSPSSAAAWRPRRPRWGCRSGSRAGPRRSV